MRSIWLRGLVLAALSSSCAVSTPGVEPTRSMPAARAGLRPEYRIFYDTLGDYRRATQYVDDVNKVTSEQILAFARAYLTPSRRAALVFTPQGNG